MKFVLPLLLLLGAAAAVCSAPSFTPDFVNIAAKAGLTAKFPNGTVSEQYILGTTGSGIAFIDYDNDGLPDIFVLSGNGGTNRMYRNLGHDRFRDVTDQLGLRSSGWAEGVCAGDYDNDGYTDLFVTYWGQNRLYRNIHGKRFEDVTKTAGLIQKQKRYNTGCAFVDYDRDGHLDLFVANYLQFGFATTPKPGSNPNCFYRGLAVSCGPLGLPFESNILYHNNGNGTFTDVSKSAGIEDPVGHYSLGVLTGDFNGDGWPDIYVACDRTPSLLYLNQKNGTFKEQAVLRGVAFDADGRAMSGMGVTAGDYDGSGRLSIFRTNFSDEFETLYRNMGHGNFDDVTLDAGLGGNTSYVGWGTGFFDFDNDGWPDLLLVNGHIYPEIDKLHIDIHYKEHAILYRNLGNGKFRDLSAHGGPGILEKHSSRGAAFGDIDNDGSVEIAINNQNEPPSLLKDMHKPPGNWVILRLIGTKSNRSAIGARVTLTAGGHSQVQEVRSGGSYLSQNDLRLHFGIGGAKKIDEISIAWPSGEHQVLKDQPCDRVLTIRQP
ncbi:MAG: CRTAC1 family protein [Bryobacteraceae bacterium]